MELFSACLQGKPLLLSASDTGLFLHSMQNDRFGRPALLCANYKNGLCGCLHNDSLYYAYINREDSLLFRRLYDSSLLFHPDNTGNVIFRAPQLVRFHNILFLFWFEVSPDSCRLKLQLPFSDVTPPLPDALQTSFPELPSLSLRTTTSYLYLFLTSGTEAFSYRYSPGASFEQIYTETDFLSELRLPWESEKEQLEQALLRAVHLSEQQQTLLTEKEQKLQLYEARLSELSSETDQKNTLLTETTLALQTMKTQLTECESARRHAEQNVTHTSLLLERAKSQYSELMQVAEQYRLEALKWYGKFTDCN